MSEQQHRRGRAREVSSDVIAALAAVDPLDLAAKRLQPRAKFLPALIDCGLVSAG
jgi:hypothetical protein